MCGVGRMAAYVIGAEQKAERGWGALEKRGEMEGVGTHK